MEELGNLRTTEDQCIMKKIITELNAGWNGGDSLGIDEPVKNSYRNNINNTIIAIINAYLIFIMCLALF